MLDDKSRDHFIEVDRYISGLLKPADKILESAERAIIDSGIPQISVSANQGKFLEVMARTAGARKILEIGTLGGYSTIFMARALPAGGKLISLEIDAKHAEVARVNIERAGLSDKVLVRVGKAIEDLPLLLAEGAGPFDMIFIDADKPPYAEYFQWALKLSRPGTLIIADNVIREGKVLNPEGQDEMVQGVARFNKALAATPGITATIIQCVGTKDHDGMAIAVVD
jgi:predicted O-methyltransferase YrrM